jgi:hypothetical protein
VKTSFANVNMVIRIPSGIPTAYAAGIVSHGINMEDTAPEAYIARTLLAGIEFKLGLSILSPRTGTTLTNSEIIGIPSLVIADRPRK